MEPISKFGQQEEKCPKAQYGEYVGCIDNKAVRGNPKDGRDRIDREHKICKLNSYQYQKEQRPCPHTVLYHKEFFSLVMPGNSDVFSNEPDKDAFVRLKMVLGVPEHIEAGIDQERPENIDDPVEPFYQLGTRKDHDHAQNKRAHDAPEQDP